MPGMRPPRKASTKWRWSSRTVAAYSSPNDTKSPMNSSSRSAITSTIASSVWNVDEILVAVGVADAVHLGDRAAELLDHFGEFVGFGQFGPVEIGLVGREFG